MANSPFAQSSIAIPVTPANGGTGIVNNSASTITISGSFPLTLVISASTNVTLPTTGTLATLAGTESFSNKTITCAAGSTSVAPLTLTSGTNLTSAIAGAFEYDGVTPYFTRATSERGVLPSTQLITLTTAFTTAGGTTAAQKLFNSPTNGTLTVAGNVTFYFDCVFILSSMSSTSGTFSFGFAGTATLTRVTYFSYAAKALANGGTAPFFMYQVNASPQSLLLSGNTATSGWATIWGKIIVGTGGTIIPSFATSVAAATVVAQDSYFRLYPAGSNTNQSVGNWT